jgi:peptidoglycan/xylan/chitin deacetylase (PgdA/CDA1 family)
MMRAQLKRFAEQALIGSGVDQLARRRQNGVLVLAYHNVHPGSAGCSGDSSLHLKLDDFVRQLDILEETSDVVPLENAFDLPQGSRRPRVAITFDDAYEGAVTCAVPELKKRGMPATIFVAPGLLGSTTWWDILADREGGSISDVRRNYALYELSGNRKAVLEWAGMDAEHDSHTLPRIANHAELAAAAADSNLTLASHTWSHPDLTAIAEDELESELSSSLAWLREHFDCVAPLLSYPYGRSNDAVESTALNTGYDAAFRVEGGWISPDHRNRPAFIPRLNIPAGISPEGFRLRLAGLGS